MILKHLTLRWFYVGDDYSFKILLGTCETIWLQLVSPSPLTTRPLYLLEGVLKQGFSGDGDLDVLRHWQLLEKKRKQFQWQMLSDRVIHQNNTTNFKPSLHVVVSTSCVMSDNRRIFQSKILINSATVAKFSVNSSVCLKFLALYSKQTHGTDWENKVMTYLCMYLLLRFSSYIKAWAIHSFCVS